MQQSILMVAGETYPVKVTKIENGNKIIPTKHGPRHKFFISLQDKNGNMFVDKVGNPTNAEYLCPNAGDCTGPDFPLTVGVIQYIKCSYLSDRGTPTIEPTEPAGSSVIDPYLKPRLQSIADAIPTQLLNQKTAFNFPTQGAFYGFSVAYAKDLKVAEIALRKKGEKVTEEDIDDILSWANLLSQGVYERMHPDAFSLGASGTP